MSPGPGIWTPRDVENKIAIASGWAEFTPQASPVYAEQDLICKNVPVTREAGAIIVAQWRCTTDGSHYPLALLTSQTPSWNHTNVNAGFWRGAAGALYGIANSTSYGKIADFVADGTIYNLIIDLRAAGVYLYMQGGTYTYPELVFSSIAGTGTPLYVGAAGYDAAFGVNFIRVPQEKLLFAPEVSDGFSIDGESDALAHAETFGLGAGGGEKFWHYRDPYRNTKALTLKGQLHCHTTNSDGVDTPIALVTAYKNAGYHFIGVTDHYNGTTYPNFTVDPGVSGITFLPSCEGGGTSVELLCWNVSQGYSAATQVVIDAVLAEGGMIGLPHPNYETPITTAFTYLWSRGLHLIEAYNGAVYNGVSGPAAGEGRAQWDAHLSLHRIFYGIFTDDCHDISDPGGFDNGWVIVFADTNTPAAIVDALKKGNFYGSNGPDFSQSFDRETGVITVTTSAAATIRFIGAGGAVLQTTNDVTTETYTLVGTELYVRAEVIRNSDSKWACGQPIMRETWSLSGGQMLNTPPMPNANLIGNSTFDDGSWWSVDTPTDWAISGGTANKAAGASARRLYKSSLITLGRFYQLTWDILNRTAGNFFSTIQYSSKYRTADGSYVDYLFSLSGQTFAIYGDAASAGSIDNVFLEEVPFTACIKAIESSTPDTEVGIDLMTVPSASMAGFILSADHPDYPCNFVLALLVRTNPGDFVYLIKYVNGVPTQVFSTSTSFADGRRLIARKFGNNYFLSQHGGYVNTGVVADAGIINNRYFGLFTPDPLVRFDNWLLRPTGTGQEYSWFNRFLR
jgi:hypothetical protein